MERLHCMNGWTESEGMAMNDRLKEKLSVLPEQPGCYLMKDKHGTVIYVGKAKSLKARVRSYFTGTHDGKTQRLVEEIADFEYIVTSSNAEALILEMNLIKKHDPKYNVMLKDDKSYPFIKITAEQHPRLLITRKVKKTGANISARIQTCRRRTKRKSCSTAYIRSANVRRCLRAPVCITIWANASPRASTRCRTNKIRRWLNKSSAF